MGPEKTPADKRRWPNVGLMLGQRRGIVGSYLEVKSVAFRNLKFSFAILKDLFTKDGGYMRKTGSNSSDVYEKPSSNGLLCIMGIG